jgi:hypothetical protein
MAIVTTRHASEYIEMPRWCACARFTIILGSPAGDNSKMNISLSIGPVIALIAGILILIVPRLLNYIVAFYLILIGLVGLFGAGSMHLH